MSRKYDARKACDPHLYLLRTTGRTHLDFQTCTIRQVPKSEPGTPHFDPSTNQEIKIIRQMESNLAQMKLKELFED
jgi:hypothetical protein